MKEIFENDDEDDEDSEEQEPIIEEKEEPEEEVNPLGLNRLRLNELGTDEDIDEPGEDEDEDYSITPFRESARYKGLDCTIELNSTSLKADILASLIVDMRKKLNSPGKKQTKGGKPYCN